MKTALLLFFFILVSFSVKSFGALPPTTLSGMDDTTKTTTFNFKVPNKQATKVTGGTLIETGNKNRLINPSFETSGNDLLLGWDISCTGAVYGTDVIYKSDSPVKALEGRQSLKLDVVGTTGGSCTFFQDTPTQPVDGIAQIYLYSTNASGVKAVKRVNDATALELDVTGKSEWQLMKFPGALGSTETGVGVTVTVGASESKTLYLDEAKVAIADVKTDATKIESQSSYLTSSSVFSNTIFKGALTDSTGSGIYSYDPVTGIYTALKKAQVTITASAITASAGALGVGARFVVAGADKDQFDHTNASIGHWASVTHSRLVNPGDTFYGHNASAVDTSGVRVSVTATTADNTELFATSADFFSTDTNTLTFKGTAITDSDPDGTFNTFSLASGGNSLVQCVTPPAQSIASMKVNGIQTFTRAYNAASTCGNPARVHIKLGRDKDYRDITLYGSTGKNGGLYTGNDVLSTTNEQGPKIFYSTTSQLLVVDAGTAALPTNTSRVFVDGGMSAYTSGYLVINAQPKKTTAVADFKEVVKSQGATGQVDIQSIFFGGGASCTTTCSSGNCTICSRVGEKISSVTWVASGVYDLNGIDGTKYICTASGVSLTALSPWHQRAASTSTKARIVFVNPSNANADAHIASVNCVGIP